MVIGPHKKKAEAKAEAKVDRAETRRRRDDDTAGTAASAGQQPEDTDEVQTPDVGGAVTDVQVPDEATAQA
jgi:hypothetical protein